jgi:pimeloyl-ACP methyl ester carboxylesterase
MSDTPVASAEPRSLSVQCASRAGLHRIAYTEWGDAANPRVLLCVHGLTRSGRDFDALARRLCARYRVVCPDVAGRGASDWLPDASLYSVPQYVADMVTLCARLDVEEVDWFGTSMGGLIGIALAALPGSPVRRLLLNDVGPRLEATGLARIDEYLCLGKPARFASLDEGIAGLARVAAAFGPLSDAQWRAINTPLLRRDGDAWVTRYDPAITQAFKAGMNDAALRAGETALWAMFDAVAVPTLVVRGAESDLLSRATLEEMRRRRPGVRTVEIARVGHAPAFVDDAQIALAEEFFCAGLAEPG